MTEINRRHDYMIISMDPDLFKFAIAVLHVHCKNNNAGDDEIRLLGTSVYDISLGITGEINMATLDSVLSSTVLRAKCHPRGIDLSYYSLIEKKMTITEMQIRYFVSGWVWHSGGMLNEISSAFVKNYFQVPQICSLDQQLSDAKLANSLVIHTDPIPDYAVYCILNAIHWKEVHDMLF